MTKLYTKYTVAQSMEVGVCEIDIPAKTMESYERAGVLSLRDFLNYHRAMGTHQRAYDVTRRAFIAHGVPPEVFRK